MSEAGAGEGPGHPGVVVCEVTTARRVGAQLRYNGGPRLAEIRYAVRIVQGPGLLRR